MRDYIDIMLFIILITIVLACIGTIIWLAVSGIFDLICSVLHSWSTPDCGSYTVQQYESGNVPVRCS